MSQTKRLPLFQIILILLSSVLTLKADWGFYEKTYLNGTVSGIIKTGSVLHMATGSIYVITEMTNQVIIRVNPEVFVLRDGNKFRLTIDGFDDPLICRKLVSPSTKLETEKTAKSQKTVTQSFFVISRIDGNFDGWVGETIFKLENGQIWQQISYDIMSHKAFHPKVLIYPDDLGYYMKVEGIDDVIMVKRLK